MQDILSYAYEHVAKSQTTQALGAAGAKGDILQRIIVVPETTAAGTIAIKDGALDAVNVFVAGTLTNLQTFVIELGARSVSGAWQITTGDNVHVIAVGKFS
jgi:D-alanyl-D-alanine carboxypeptidase